MDRLFDGMIAWSIRQRLIVLLGGICLTIAGLWSAMHARADVLPDFTPPYVIIQTEAVGMATPEVETLVTTPLERVLLGTPNVTTVRSTSALGVSMITILFEDGVDIYRARQLVTERLDVARPRLPPSVKPPQLAPIVAPINALMKLCITTDRPYTEQMARDLRSFAEWTVRPRLLSVAGVTQVISLGGALERVEVRPDPLRMRQRGVSPALIRTTIAGSQAFLGAGFLEVGASRTQVQADLRLSVENVLKTLEALPLTVAAAPSSAAVTAGAPATPATLLPIRLGDVAEIVRDDEPHLSGALYDGRPAVYLQINKLPGADILALTRKVESTLVELERELPPGARFEQPVHRQATIIEHSISSVGRSMAIGSLLVIVVLIAFLRSPRLAVISLVAIPLSVLSAVAVLVWRGETINAMTLGGLALSVGEVVDDAIVDVENVWRRLRLNRELAEPRGALDVIRDASHEVRGSVVYATLIVGLVLVPVLLLGGVTGNIFSPLARAYVLAIGASLVVALTVTPAMCAWLLPKMGERVDGAHGETWLSKKLHAGYARVLSVSLRAPWVVLGVAAALIAAAVFILPRLGGRFLPEFNEGALIAKLDAAPGTSINESMRLAAVLDPRLRAGLAAHVASRAGRAENDEDAAPAHRIEIDIVFAKDEKRDLEALAAASRAIIEKLPGVEFGIEGLLEDRLHDILAGNSAPIVAKIIGPDLLELRRIAAVVAKIMAGITGIDAVHLEPQVDVPQLRIRPNERALSQYGVRPLDLADDVIGWLQGQRATQLIEPSGRLVDVVVAGPRSTRNRWALADLPISTPGSGPLPLSALASIDDVPSPIALYHEQGERRVSVEGEAHGASLSRSAEALGAKLAKLVLPRGYRIELAGEAHERGAAATSLLLTGALVMLGVFALLRLAFSSTVDALIVLSNIPLGLVGGVLAAMFSPGGLSVSSFVGFVTLFGIIARNGIMLVSHKNQLDREFPELPALERVVRAAHERLLPIVMTAATAELGLLPLALSAGVAGSELEVPMARIVCAGLVTSTVMNMIVVPCVYAALLRRRAARA